MNSHQPEILKNKKAVRPSGGINNRRRLLNALFLCFLLYFGSSGRLPAQCDFTNKVVNGDFESGAVGFSSVYSYCNSSWCLFSEGMYTVGADPSFYHPDFTGSDHTSGTGSFMMANGTGTADAVVWTQTISNLHPNTDYHFSAWICNLTGNDPAKIQFMINDVRLGDVKVTPSTTYQWDNFYITWNSGANTSATITILDQNTELFGNDFGVDDITFIETCALPVLFSEFKAIRDEGAVKLIWTTERENNSDDFVIETSEDGLHFTEAGKMKAAGRTFNHTNYQYIIDAPEGLLYYRIRALDTDGKNTVSPVTACEGYTSPAEVFPNPVRDYLTVKLNTTNQTAEISCRNALGEEVFTDIITADLRKKTYDAGMLTPGVYIISIRTEEGIEVKKIIKE